MDRLHSIWFDRTNLIQSAKVRQSIPDFCEVTHCEDLTEGLELCHSGSVDLVFFDFDYPDRRGLREFMQVRRECPTLPTIMLTLQHSEELATWAFRARVWDFMVKPVAHSELTNSLSHLMGTHERVADFSILAQHIPDEASAAEPALSEVVLKPALNYVAQNHHSKILLEQAAEVCGLTPLRFSRLFKETYDTTFREYLLHYRLQMALRLLETPKASVSDVAFAVGFNDSSYFTRAFRKHYGIVPSDAIGFGRSALPPARASKQKF